MRLCVLPLIINNYVPAREQVSLSALFTEVFQAPKQVRLIVSGCSVEMCWLNVPLEHTDELWSEMTSQGTLTGPRAGHGYSGCPVTTLQFHSWIFYCHLLPGKWWSVQPQQVQSNSDHELSCTHARKAHSMSPLWWGVTQGE